MGEQEAVIKMAKVHDMIRILESCLAYNQCLTGVMMVSGVT